MNSIISKTFIHFSTELLFLRYKKISKKSVKLSSFIQCSVHIFLGHDGCFLRNKFKNFLKPHYEELSSKSWSILMVNNSKYMVTASYFLKHFLSKALSIC